MVIKQEDIVRGISTEELVKELNRRKLENAQIIVDEINEKINELITLGVSVIDEYSCDVFDYITLDLEKGYAGFKFKS